MSRKILLKQLILTGITLIITTTIILFVMMPAWLNLNQTLAQANQMESKLKETQDRLEFLSQQDRNKNTIENQYQRALTYLPDTSNQSNLILQLHEMGKVAQVTVDKISVANQIEQSVGFTLEINGSYQATLTFIKNLSQALRANLLSNIDLSIADSGQGIKTTLQGKAFFKPLPKNFSFADQKPAAETKILDQLIHFGEPIKPDEIPGGSSEPFGSL